MAKRTGESKFAEKDASRSIRRHYLSYVQDLKDIYYDYEESASKDVESAEGKIPSSTLIAQTKEEPRLSEKPVEPSPSLLSAEVVRERVPDVPISATDIVRSLIGHKLRKHLEEVPIEKSIKEIAGGKSTLQNELVGDLDNEFGQLPDGIEDLPLSSLGEALGSSFSGALGKRSLALLARLTSSTLPAGFNQVAVRSYLEKSWGLGPARQENVLLFAITAEPPSRLPSVEAAKEWLDSNSKRYAASCGLVLTPPSQLGARESRSSAVDSEELNAMKEEQRKFLAKQLSVLATHLNIDSSGHARIAELETSIQELQGRLDTWSSEFGSDDFHLGIKPLFDPKKIRRYSSWWNYARLDALKLHHDSNLGQFHIEDEQQADEITLKLTNRLDKYAQSIVSYFLKATRARGPNHTVAPVTKKLESVVDIRAQDRPPVFRYRLQSMKPETRLSGDGQIEYKEVPRRSDQNAQSYLQLLSHSSKNDENPYVHIRTRSPTAQWVLDGRKTERLMATFRRASETGLTFTGKRILITGAGPGSIGAEVIKGLLMGGAKVIVTTSRTPANTAAFFRDLYANNCSRDSELRVIPFNQGSARDCEEIIDYIYDTAGLNTNIDAVIPFAAIPEIGMEVDDIGARAELAHRLMLTNVFRLVGRVVNNKRRRRIETQPTQVILPLSPNTGTFGGDGLYSASKLGLESLLKRFSSEHWAEYMTICGALIGWTRGTGLMHGNDNVAPIIESKGALTFSQPEMALNIIALLSPDIAQICESEAVLADLNGGLDLLPGLSQIMATARSQLSLKSLIRKTILKEDARQTEILRGSDKLNLSPQGRNARKTARIAPKIGFPSLPDYGKTLLPLQDLQGMVDFSSTIVIVGFAELGPWGSARTRWEMESCGKLSPAGYAELAWIMNLIRHVDADINGEHYCGWVDARTGEQVHDSDIETKYGNYILDHSGVRFIEPGSDYDPAKKEYLQEIAVEEDLPEFETGEANAKALKLRLQDSVNIRRSQTSDEFLVQIKRGAHIHVPKILPAECGVAGMLPSGWSPIKYGIPEDMVHQADPVTLYSLCCAAEALYSAGIIDSLEVFKYIHVSEVGNMLGSCIGGSTKTRHMYKDQYLDKQVQSDIIQETFLNASATWINMLLLGASGPIKTPNGTCATGVESLEIGCESILAGKTKFCLVGGVDDLQEDEAYGFAKIKATVNTNAETAKGRVPQEMSRPMTESRAGFVEAQGCGLQIITTASLALEMGLPVYAIVASSTMAADKISRSLPAPGQGVLTFARESARASKSPLLSLNYRRQQLQACISDIEDWRSAHFNLSFINAEADGRIKAIRKMFGTSTGLRSQDSEISPIRASLAVWGLTVDDIDIVSLHATSTGANDKNEPEVVNRQFDALGRTPGRPLMAICQKGLTGHPKGAAASWMLNGCLQVLETGLVPGNRNADSIDDRLRKFEHLVFPTEAIQTKEVKAFLLNSFGFGQKGAQMIGIAPKYLFATLTQEEYGRYCKKVTRRKRLATRAWIKAVNTNSVFKARASPPYSAEDETTVLMDPLARIPDNSNEDDLRFDRSNLHPASPGEKTLLPKRFKPTPNAKPRTLSSLSSGSLAPLSAPKQKPSPPIPGPKPASLSLVHTISTAPSSSTETVNVGVDVEDMATFTSHENEVFVKRNYTMTETAQCTTNLNPREAFAANWTAKEAVFKSLGIKSKGAAAPMRDIEILRDGEGVRVLLHGDALTAARANSICDIQVNMSTSNDTALAIAIAKRGSGEVTYTRTP
ncbi:phosphopantetheine-protein transferase [Periconia macrospinosa]|uniref:Phosphopantetheine-protein transferase n=1 Tax=Periconia macrospinosa TaxID=97972 RepID=A0A2V1E0X1_9PLEO|nr:phosphopantetheine-protein transferase [Periconia macrospinosa]